MEESKLETELNKKKIELMGTPEYKEYQDRRYKVMQELRVNTPDFDDWGTSYVNEYLNAIVGRSPLE